MKKAISQKNNKKSCQKKKNILHALVVVEMLTKEKIFS